MQLFIDIDGVLLNFERAFVGWLNREHAMNLPPDYQAESWNFEEVLEREFLLKNWMHFLESPDAGRMGPLVEPRRFNAWASAHSVHLVTNFPEPHMEKRRGNLSELGFRYDTLHYCGPHGFKDLLPRSKGEVVDSLRSEGEGGLFVDDHPDNCLDVHALCPEVEVWLMSRRFNQDFRHPGIRRAPDWNRLFQRLDGAPAPSNGSGAGGA